MLRVQPLFSKKTAVLRLNKEYLVSLARFAQSEPIIRQALSYVHGQAFFGGMCAKEVSTEELFNPDGYLFEDTAQEGLRLMWWLAVFGFVPYVFRRRSPSSSEEELVASVLEFGEADFFRMERKGRVWIECVTETSQPDRRQTTLEALKTKSRPSYEREAVVRNRVYVFAWNSSTPTSDGRCVSPLEPLLMEYADLVEMRNNAMVADANLSSPSIITEENPRTDNSQTNFEQSSMMELAANHILLDDPNQREEYRINRREAALSDMYQRLVAMRMPNKIAHETREGVPILDAAGRFEPRERRKTHVRNVVPIRPGHRVANQHLPQIRKDLAQLRLSYEQRLFSALGLPRSMFYQENTPYKTEGFTAERIVRTQAVLIREKFSEFWAHVYDHAFRMHEDKRITQRINDIREAEDLDKDLKQRVINKLFDLSAKRHRVILVFKDNPRAKAEEIQFAWEQGVITVEEKIRLMRSAVNIDPLGQEDACDQRTMQTLVDQIEEQRNIEAGRSIAEIMQMLAAVAQQTQPQPSTSGNGGSKSSSGPAKATLAGIKAPVMAGLGAGLDQLVGKLGRRVRGNIEDTLTGQRRKEYRARERETRDREQPRAREPKRRKVYERKQKE